MLTVFLLYFLRIYVLKLSIIFATSQALICFCLCQAYCDGKLEKGDFVAINLQNNRAPIAVGRTQLSSEVTQNHAVTF